MGVEDYACDFIGFIGYEGLFEEGGERKVGQGHLRGYSLDGGAGCDASEFVSGAGRGGFGEEGFDVLKVVNLAIDRMSQEHLLLFRLPLVDCAELINEL